MGIMSRRCRGSTFGLIVSIAVSLIVIATGGRASAAEEVAWPVDDELHLQATFSFWATSLNGSYSIGDFSTSSDICFSELIQHADYAFNPGAELTKGNWGLFFNSTISKVSTTTDFDFGGSADTEMTIAAFDLLIGYTILHKRYDNGMSLTLTPAAGAQLTTIDGEINPQNFDARSNNVTFVDPVIGGRVVWGLNRDWAWRNEGTIGGFGVGTQLTWTAGSYIDWQFAKSFLFSFGYRAMSWDYDLGAGDMNMTLHGPWMGITWEIF